MWWKVRLTETQWCPCPPTHQIWHQETSGFTQGQSDAEEQWFKWIQDIEAASTAQLKMIMKENVQKGQEQLDKYPQNERLF